MLWIILGLTCACFKAVLGACMRSALLSVDKQRFGDFHAGHFLILAVNFGSTTVVLAGLLAWDGLPEVREGFWTIMAVLLALEIIAQTLTSISLSIEEISAVETFMPLNLVFVGVFAWAMLDEVPTVAAAMGCACIIGGAIWLSFPRTIRRPRMFAVVLRVIAAICFALVSPNLKRAIQYSSPYFFGFVYLALLTAISLVALWGWVALRASQREAIKAVARNRRGLAMLGLATPIAYIPQYPGVILVPLLYFGALNRLAPLFSIAIGYFWLKERDALRRLPAALVMVAGAVLVVFGR